MKRIKLANANQFILCDDEDFYRLNCYSWSLNGGNKNIQASVCGNTAHIGNFLLNVPNGFECDHKDNNIFNNRKRNLRIATKIQNSQNKPKREADTTSQYKGVYWSILRQRWIVEITVNKVKKYIGCYTNEEEAAKAYDIAATVHFGEFARTNLIQ